VSRKLKRKVDDYIPINAAVAMDRVFGITATGRLSKSRSAVLSWSCTLFWYLATFWIDARPRVRSEGLSLGSVSNPTSCGPQKYGGVKGNSPASSINNSVEYLINDSIIVVWTGLIAIYA
jgi:hypothetical protein